MGDPLPVPTPSVPPPAPRTNYVLMGIIALLVSLLVWRWYADHYITRPAEIVTLTPHRVDLNKATRDELLSLPHVGPKTADNILAHKQTHGHFKSIDDLRDVHGVGDLTLNKIRPYLKVTPTDEVDPNKVERLTRAPKSVPSAKTTTSQRININTATLAELDTLPNIGPVIAQRIIDERTKKPFASITDLRRVSGIGAKRLEGLKDYVTVE